jgi:hypothetical protein
MRLSPRRAPSFRSVAVLVLLVVFAALAPGSASAAAHRGARRTAVVPAALRSAAVRANRADRVLVSAARALHSCIRASNGTCAGNRSAVQSAGHSFSAAERNLALKARRAGRGRASSSAVQTPTLKVGGVKLSWSAIARASSYVLASEVPGQGARYAVSHTNSATPPPVPGVTVTYMVRTAERSSHWSNAVKVTYPAAAPTAPTTPAPPAASVPTQELDMRAAPSLHLSGQTISWNLVAGVSTYVLMTKVPGQAEAFTAVSGSSVTPAAVPGKTVSYSVRTAVDGSAWAPNVTITYPVTPPPAAPPVAPSEPSQSIGASEGFQPGINGGTASQDYAGAATLGAKVVRITMPIEVPASAWEGIIANYAAKGMRVEPLASFYGRIPSVAEAQNVATWAKAFGPGGTFWAKRSDGNLAIRSIEFGNEASYGYQYGDSAGAASYTARAKSYAIRFKEAAEAISATGIKVGLLADADDPTGDWMNGMFAAVPNLGNYVGGWISHPYGTGAKSKLMGVINQTAAHGASSSIPIDVTEWGISTDNGTCVYENYGMNPCMSYQEAGEQLKRGVNEIKSMVGNRLGLFLLYQVRDQAPGGSSNNRESFFGVLQQSDAAKPGYTQAVQELLAQ